MRKFKAAMTTWGIRLSSCFYLFWWQVLILLGTSMLYSGDEFDVPAEKGGGKFFQIVMTDLPPGRDHDYSGRVLK